MSIVSTLGAASVALVLGFSSGAVIAAVPVEESVEALRRPETCAAPLVSRSTSRMRLVEQSRVGRRSANAESH